MFGFTYDFRQGDIWTPSGISWFSSKDEMLNYANIILNLWADKPQDIVPTYLVEFSREEIEQLF